LLDAGPNGGWPESKRREGAATRQPLAATIASDLPNPRSSIYTLYLPHQELQAFMPKRTFQPNRRHRSKTHGFLTRMETKGGRAVISRRRAKGRKRVSVKPGFRE